MKNNLEKLKEDVESTAIEAVKQIHQKSDRDDVLLKFGAIGGMRVVSRFIGVSTISVLKEIRDEEIYKSFGYTRFDEFLENEPLAKQYIGISYRTFNNLEKQLEAEGDELYELLNNFKIPISTRKLSISNGETQISIDGDQLLIGEEKISLDSPKVQQVIKELANETKQLAERQEKSEKTIEKLTSQVETGTDEYNELRRSYDSLNEGSDFDRAKSKLINAFIRFNDTVSNLEPYEKEDNEPTLDTLWTLLEECRKRFFSKRSFNETIADATVSDMAKQVFADDDDFGDEEEK